MANKCPINQSFQRLNDFPLDETIVFDTLAQAQDYASNNPTAYKGQIIHVKDARTDEEINDGKFIYEETCYISLLKNVVPICSFTYEAMGLFFDLMYEVLNRPTEETKKKLDILKEIMYDNYTYKYCNELRDIPTGDYHTQPWQPLNYNDKQIALRMYKPLDDLYIGNLAASVVIEGTTYTVEDIRIKDNGFIYYYKVITLDDYPTRVAFTSGFHILEVVHMCNTSNITDMKDMFFNCNMLTTIKNINEFDTSNVTNMNSMFYNTPNIEQLDVSNFDTSKVTDMAHMFRECGKLTELDVSGFDTSNVTDMKYMFRNLDGLTELDVTNFDTSNVTSMERMFYGCVNLVELDLSSFNTSNVTNMEDMFYGDESLTYLDISNFDTSNVTTMSWMYKGCVALELSNIIMTNCSPETIEQLELAYEVR